MRAIKRKDSNAPKSRLSLAPRRTPTPGVDHEPPTRRQPIPEDASAPVSAPLPATFTARLVALAEGGRAWIAADGEDTSSGRPDPRAPVKRHGIARSTVALTPDHVGREVLVCRANRAGEPVILGLLHDGATPGPSAPDIDLIVERQRIVLAANTELVLRCGDGSITLSADGKVTIRGLDVVSSATRTQRIRGGAVRIN